VKLLLRLCGAALLLQVARLDGDLAYEGELGPKARAESAAEGAFTLENFGSDLPIEMAQNA